MDDGSSSIVGNGMNHHYWSGYNITISYNSSLELREISPKEIRIDNAAIVNNFAPMLSTLDFEVKDWEISDKNELLTRVQGLHSCTQWNEKVLNGVKGAFSCSIEQLGSTLSWHYILTNNNFVLLAQMNLNKYKELFLQSVEISNYDSATNIISNVIFSENFNDPTQAPLYGFDTYKFGYSNDQWSGEALASNGINNSGTIRVGSNDNNGADCLYTKKINDNDF
jgi:hypothetical protein